MGFRYIGSKARVATEIAAAVGGPSEPGRFVDGFCGTGVVAAAAANRGWSVHLNDTLMSAVVMASARLISHDQIEFSTFGGYHSAIETLNAVKPFEGFITREYSPISRGTAGVERRYFTVDNATKIDSMRRMLDEWRNAEVISEVECRLLLGDLMLAANAVANIAGTYGCFLREWSPAALRPLMLEPRSLPRHGVDVTVSVGDALGVNCSPDDVAYFDPPYTKRQYAAYYHVLETIAAGDEPLVDGVTGLRPWKHLASDYCYRVRALQALDRLVADCPASKIFLSYSSEGHVRRSALEPLLAGHGDLVVHQLGFIGRYRPNEVARRRPQVEEYLFEILKPTRQLEDVA